MGPSLTCAVVRTYGTLARSRPTPLLRYIYVHFYFKLWAWMTHPLVCLSVFKCMYCVCQCLLKEVLGEKGRMIVTPPLHSFYSKGFTNLAVSFSLLKLVLYYLFSLCFCCSVVMIGVCLSPPSPPMPFVLSADLLVSVLALSLEKLLVNKMALFCVSLFFWILSRQTVTNTGGSRMVCYRRIY